MYDVQIDVESTTLVPCALYVSSVHARVTDTKINISNIEKRRIGHQKSYVVPSYEGGNGPTQAPRNLKYGPKPKGSPYMRETVENGWLRQAAMTNNFQISGNTGVEKRRC